MAIKKNPALIRIVKAHDQIDERAFARAARSSQSDLFSKRYFQGDILQNRGMPIGKGEVLDPDTLTEGGEGTRLGGLNNCRLFGVKIFEATNAYACGREGEVQVGDPFDREWSQHQRGEKGDQAGSFRPRVENKGDEEADSENAKNFYDGVQEIAGLGQFHGHSDHLVCQFPESFHLAALHTVSLDDANGG